MSDLKIFREYVNEHTEPLPVPAWYGRLWRHLTREDDLTAEIVEVTAITLLAISAGLCVAWFVLL